MHDLPSWAAEWLTATCGCGARLVRTDCYCGGHTACSASGLLPETCTPPPTEGTADDA